MKFDININANVHIHHDADMACFRNEVLGALDTIQKGIETMAVDLGKLQAAVEKQTTVTTSAVTLIQGLADQIRNLPANQAAIDELADKVQAQAQSLADAVTSNTPTP